MDRRRFRSALLAAALLVVLAAYALLLSLASPVSAPSAGARSDAVLMAGVLIAVLSAGIAAAARPSGCRDLILPTGRAEGSSGARSGPADSPSFQFVAHHCNCGRFADHLLRVAGRERCAGCTGMATGGIVGIGIAITLASGLLFQDAETDLAIVFVASLLSVGGLVRIYGRQGVPALHAAANVALVVGMVLLTALLATQGLLVGLFGLAVSLAVVGLRIDMSRLRHLSIFLGCPWREACRGASAVASAA